MSTSANVIRVVVHEDGGLAVLAYTTGYGKVPIVQADVATIEYSIDEIDESITSLAVIKTWTAISVSSSIFNTLVTDDPRWENCSTGYNFSYVLPGDSFPDGNKTYWVQIRFTMLSGPPILLKIKAPSIPTLQS